jgi:hypothetical protein
MPDGEITFDECMGDAIEAINDAMAKLNLSFAYCPACNSRRYHNFNEKKEGDTLALALARLETMMVTRKKGTEYL